MKKQLIVGLFSGVLLLSGSAALAASSAGSIHQKVQLDVSKVAVVDVTKVLKDSSQVSELKSSLRKQFKPREDKIVKAQNDLRKNLVKLDRDHSVLSKSKLTDLKTDIKNQQKSLQKLQTNFQRDLFAAQDTGMQKILSALKTRIQSIADKKGLTLVLAKNAVAYAPPSYDITDEVARGFK